MSRWIRQQYEPDFRIELKADKVIYEGKTAFQSVAIFENLTFDRVLMLNGVVQTTEEDEYIYHEMFAHVPILGHGAVRTALIIGGGDGGLLEEMLKHRGIEQVTMVEIDAEVIELSRKYLSSICGKAFEDPRTNLVIGDGLDYLEECGERYDVIAVDCTDPDPGTPAEVLYSERFYRACAKCLAPGGVLVAQNEVVFIEDEHLKVTTARMRRVFKETPCFLVPVPSFFGGAMAFSCGTDNADFRDTSVELLARRFDEAALKDIEYYTPDTHQAAFALPAYIKELVL